MNPDRIHIFLGPTLPHAKARQLASARYGPPAAMGDITRAVTTGAEAIILIDGVFERGPSVWHKEIMWALSKGVAVIGAASMGALRAAELDQHGMLGCGDIYTGYASGELTDDDEVAVTHAPQDLHWLPLSDAMVDIRHRMAAAKAAGLVTGDQARQIIHIAKDCFFKNRDIRNAVAATIGDAELCKRVLVWLSLNTKSLKQQDCENLLRDLHRYIVQAQLLLNTVPGFEPTVYLRRLEQFGFNPPAQR